MAAAAADPQAAAVLLPAPAGRESSPPGKRTAYRLALAGDTVRLLATDELQGDFHRRRGRLAWWPGMLYFRLLDSRQQVLAEETLAAPEPVCVVLESALPGAADTPRPPAAIASASPVVFQVRLPSVAGAAQLQVYRLTGVRPADANAELPAKLIGSLALQR